MVRPRIFATLLAAVYTTHGNAQTSLSTSNFEVGLAPGSGVLQSLRPKSKTTFDFSPSDVFELRNGPGQYHTGDLNFRYRVANGIKDTWIEGDTAAQRLNVSSTALNGSISASLNSALGNSSGSLSIARRWYEDQGDLALEFTLRNDGSDAIEVGSLDMPIEFNNIFTNRTAVDVTEKCVLVDPYIGLGAGYAQVTRLTGTGPNLVITPLTSDSKFEAWRFLHEPRGGPLGYQIQTYEGNYAWQVYSQAYAENEWKGADPWNSPSSKTIAPGAELRVGLRFSIADTVDKIESTAAAAGLPVAVGVPGYVLPTDLIGKLFVNSTRQVATVDVEPRGALNLTTCESYGSSWTSYDVQAADGVFGRARVIIVYTDGTQQAVHYWVAHSSKTALSELGQFLTIDQWFNDTSDPFGRAPSVITYDRSADSVLLQDNRTWIAGLSDEGGAGSFLAAGMKQAFYPDASEVSRLEEFVHEVVWGRLQISAGNETYGVRKSLFYYEPDLVPGYEYSPEFNWTINPGESWDKEAAYLIDRTYDYVHVSALYWGLYRAGRTHPDTLKQATPDWYLLQSYETASYALSNSTDGTPNTGYIQVGLMGETVWLSLLSDLRAANHTDEAVNLERLVRARQTYWAGLPDPYGSEMAWDSTGEEGVYAWSAYFNDSVTAEKTLEAIRGYMPTIAHWGYNGNARRYWDFLYAGDIKLARYERQIHHYGSGLNALPLLANYHARDDPQSEEAVYDLRVGYGGNQGPLSNIDAGGFGSMAFHGYPDTLRWDAYSGDYGPNFLGHVLGSATYLVDHPIFGYVSFGGNVEVSGDGSTVSVEPRDSIRKRVFIAPVGLWVELDAGEIEMFTYDASAEKVNVTITASGAQKVHMQWKQSASTVGRVQLATDLQQDAYGFVVDMAGGENACVEFTATKSY